VKDGKHYKEYFGSASEFQKGEKKNVEGKKMFVEHKGSLKHTLIEMEQDLQSAISYSGGNKLEAIRNVDYVIVKNSIFNGDKVY
jgi:GMP reductase